jgi:hypothetical protein
MLLPAPERVGPEYAQAGSFRLRLMRKLRRLAYSSRCDAALMYGSLSEGLYSADRLVGLLIQT